MKLRALAVLGVVSCASLLGRPSSARACINGIELEWERQVYSQAGQIAVAETELTNGRPVSAAGRVREQFPQIRGLDAKAAPLARRALRVYALAIVRADGKVEEAQGWARWGNLEWAHETLRDLEAASPNNPAKQADLAEAQIALPHARQLGVTRLEDLDGRDLLGSPYAYLALARARQAEGDHGGTLAAVRRCAMMSSDRRRCEMPVARKT
jgi:hypothetical protein